MINVIENYNLNSKKKRISESIDDIGNIFQILQTALPKIFDEQELDNIDQLIINVSDTLDDIILDERYYLK
jgi:hypothetical protein